MDRAEALRDADAVLVTVLAGNTEVWKYDITIPKQYGVDVNVDMNAEKYSDCSSVQFAVPAAEYCA